MKILQALVGYLAVTALRLPFYPFAFAHPLAAIDYDGYVNTMQLETPIDGALIKHVLGNIVETCQTVTSQNHSDSSALMKRVSGDIIEARQFGIIDAAIILALVGLVAVNVLWISGDNPVRADVEFLVDHFD